MWKLKLRAVANCLKPQHWDDCSTFSPSLIQVSGSFFQSLSNLCLQSWETLSLKHSLEEVCNKLLQTSFGRGPVLSIFKNEGGEDKLKQSSQEDNQSTVSQFINWYHRHDSSPTLTITLEGRQQLSIFLSRANMGKQALNDLNRTIQAGSKNRTLDVSQGNQCSSSFQQYKVFNHQINPNKYVNMKLHCQPKYGKKLGTSRISRYIAIT